MRLSVKMATDPSLFVTSNRIMHKAITLPPSGAVIDRTLVKGNVCS
jgi:hypothetical protein